MNPFPRRPLAVLTLLVLSGSAALAAPPGAAAERGPLRRAVAPTPTPAFETEARVIVKYRADAALMRALSAGGSTGSSSGSNTGVSAVGSAASPPQHAQALSARLGLVLTNGRTIGARAQVLRGKGLSSGALVERLAAQPDVEYAVVDGRMRALAAPNDPRYGVQVGPVTPTVGQWYLRAPTSATIVDPTSVVAAINTEAAWNITTGSGVVVAVLDTGVRRDHPDLAPKLLAGYDFIKDLAVSGDGTPRDADPSDPGDYLGSELSSWHGTQTAGLVGAATNNGIGMAGSGRDVMVLPVRVLGRGGGFDSDIQAAMLWAAGLSSDPVVNPNPARVVNLSLGATGACSAAYLDVVRQLNAANIVVVAAAGNDGLAVGTPANCKGITAAGVAYGVIAVAGIRHAGTKVGYSDLGPEVTIAAPAGNCVNLTGPCLYPLLTTSNSGSTTPVTDGAGGSIYTGSGGDASLGTSFAAPLVAGTVGLMLAANPSLTPAQVAAAIRSSARPFPSSGAGAGVSACTAPSGTAQDAECYCTTSTCGAGMLDAGAAVAAIAAATANIAVASTTVTPGTAVALDGSASRGSGISVPVVGYLWAISSGGSLASFSSATNAATATLQTSAAGTVVVSLTVTDAAGKVATSSVTLTLGSTAPAPAAGGGDSGGGGAMAAPWLLGWLGAVLAVWVVTPRARRRPGRAGRSLALRWSEGVKIS